MSYVIIGLIIVACIIHSVLKKSKETADQAVNDAIVPGVMGQTGMETVEIVKGIVKETKPDLVIAIDALAARNTKRLNRTIQVADTGIQPGITAVRSARRHWGFL